MRKISCWTAMLLVAALLVPTVVTAQGFDPEEFTPSGYTYCGIKLLGQSGWLMDPGELSGASQVAFASGLTCQAARRNIGRIVYPRGGGQPKAPGYRCRYIRQGHEFSDVRCIKPGDGGKFRVQGGS